MGEFLDEFFFVAAQFNPLKLTDGEIGLFTSVLIICPGELVSLSKIGLCSLVHFEGSLCFFKFTNGTSNEKEIVYIWQTFKFPGFVLITHVHDVFLYYFADRKGLNKKNAIAKIQSLFHQALFYLMKHNHPGITVLPYKWRLTKTLFNN